jgi:squalene monooxygenase
VVRLNCNGSCSSLPQHKALWPREHFKQFKGDIFIKSRYNGVLGIAKRTNFAPPLEVIVPDNANTIIIVGGGFTGATAAVALADGRRRIHLLEAQDGRQPRFSGELIHPLGVDVLDELNLINPLSRAGGIELKGFMVHSRADRTSSVLPYQEVNGARPYGLAMHCHEMVQTLRERARQCPGVELQTNKRVVDFLREGKRVIGVHTSDGDELRADLVLVAQGRQAPLRQTLGLAGKSRLLSFSAAVLLKETALPEAGFAHIFLGARGPVIAHSIGTDGVRVCIDLPVNLGDKNTIGPRIVSGYCPHLTQILGSGLARSLQHQAPQICANYAVYTHHCTAPGVALIGDAAGCTHPLTGAGMTTCLTDIRILTEELKKNGSCDDALRRYQKRRYRFARAREMMADALYDVFRGEGDGMRAMRSAIFRYWNNSARSRAVSLALLSGHESGPQAFCTEYVRVVLESVHGVLAGRQINPPLNGRTSALVGLGTKSVEKLERFLVGQCGGVPNCPDPLS